VPKLDGMSSDDMRPSMSFLLMARYSGRPIIPLDLVVRVFFYASYG
jgi:hypothetical protein